MFLSKNTASKVDADLFLRWTSKRCVPTLAKLLNAQEPAFRSRVFAGSELATSSAASFLPILFPSRCNTPWWAVRELLHAVVGKLKAKAKASAASAARAAAK